MAASRGTPTGLATANHPAIAKLGVLVAVGKEAFMPSIRSLNLLVLVLTLLCLGGCQTARLFHADFQADAIGDAPAASPPTDPVGDYISYAPTQPGQQQLNVSSLMGKSLMIRATAMSYPFAFVAIEKPYGDNPTYAIWTGAPLGAGGPAQGITIALASEHYQRAVTITCKNGKVYEGFHTEASTANLLGDCPYAHPQTVIISVDPSAKTYNLSIFQSSPAAPDVILTGQPIDNDAFFDSERLMLAVFVEGGGEVGNPVYALDDILITQKEPDVAAMKAHAAAVPKPNPGAGTRPEHD